MTAESAQVPDPGPTAVEPDDGDKTHDHTPDQADTMPEPHDERPDGLDVTSSLLDQSVPMPTRKKKIKPLRLGVKTIAFAIVINFLVLPLIPGFRKAATELLDVQPALLVLALGLQVGAWYTYSVLTRAALGDGAKQISRMRMFRIQMSTKALSLSVPGGNAAGSALGYRLMTLSGVRGADAGFALATAGIASAVVLNLIFWTGLLISIPTRGVNSLYVTGALAGVMIMLVAAGLVMGLMHGQGRAERIIRWIAVKLRFNGDSATAALRQVGSRLEDLIDDRQILKRVVFWAIVNWMLDAMSLWVFLRAFGQSLALDALLVSFGLANIMAVVPFTPGGLGVVDATYTSTLLAFGVPRSVVALGVASYRLAQLWLPILIGAFFYATLRIGPWSISRRERLARLRTLAHDYEAEGESTIDFFMRGWPRRPVGPMREVALTQHEAAAAARVEAIIEMEHLEELPSQDIGENGIGGLEDQ